MKRIWGFDLGTASVGFSIVDYDESQSSGRIVRLGVRVFQEGVIPEGGGKSRVPPNKTRRTKRLMRRQIRRKKQRRRELGRLLHQAGLLPAFGTQEWKDIVSEPGRKDGWGPLVDPYKLRARALEERLAPYEIGRVLYHLAKRRGFLGRRIDKPREEEAKKEEGVVKEGIERTRLEIGNRTLGSMLAAVADPQRKRGRYLHRSMIEDEFERVWSKQASYHPALMSNVLKARLRKTMFHQRPTFWRTRTLGKCPFESNSPLCITASWQGQRFLSLKRLNDLRLAGGNSRPLLQDERNLVLPLLDTSVSTTFGSIRKTLRKLWAEQGISKDQKFTHELGAFGPKKDKREIPGNAAEARLRSIFGPAWTTLPARKRICAELAHRLFDADYRRVGNARIEIRTANEAETERHKFATWAEKAYGISAEQAQALSMLGDTLPSGWLRYSDCAVARMLPLMECGMSEYEARREAYPDKTAFPSRELAAAAEALDRLPSHPAHQPETRNPMVRRTLTELRKVVNNLLAVYGKPDLIRIELARDPKMSLARKADFETFQRSREKLRKKAVDDLVSNGIPKPSGEQIEKWLLWKEAREQCPYTGKHVCFDDLFRTGLYQIEHILPKGRSLDDGFGNKTLCHADANRLKGNNTPFEFFRTEKNKQLGDWEEVQQRLRKLSRVPGDELGWGMPDWKVRRFLAESFNEFGSSEFSERQLQDTRYAAKESRAFLLRLGVPVKTCNGALTRHLCREWGLDSILNPKRENKKNRADHRHHAIDALAVALTTDAFVKRLSEFFAREKRGEKPDMPRPWDNIWEDARSALVKVVISYRTERKISGPLHEERPLRLIRGAKPKREGFRFYARREPVETLTDKALDKIPDEIVRGKVRSRFIAAKGKADGNRDEHSAVSVPVAGNGYPIRKVRLWHERRPGALVPLGSNGLSFADRGELVLLAIYRTSSGEYDHSPLTRFDANRLLAANKGSSNQKSLIPRVRDDGARLIATLAQNDVLERPLDGRPPEYFVVRKVNAKGRIFYKPATMAVDPKPEVSFSSRQVGVGELRKVSVDPIGRVRLAHD